MTIYAVINSALLAIAVVRPGWAGMWAVFLTSFFMSIMFPTIFALGLEGLGPLVKLGGSLLVMAIVGGATLTPIMGWISQHSAGIAAALLGATVQLRGHRTLQLVPHAAKCQALRGTLKSGRTDQE